MLSICSSYRSASTCAALVLGFITTGCTGLNNSLPQTLGVNSASRVPAPATGSFATPNSYNGAGSNLAPTGAPPATGNTPAGMKTSQASPLEQPTTQLLSSLHQAQSQLNSVTHQARDTINQSAESLNASVSSATQRIDRLGQGVIQASAILSDAAKDSVGSGVASSNTSPANTPVGPEEETATLDPNAAWRRPTPR